MLTRNGRGRARGGGLGLRLIDGLLRRLVKRGSLTLIDAAGGARSFGDGGDPTVAIRISDPSWYGKIALNPELAAGEAYMEGALTVERGSLRDFMQVFHQNKAGLRRGPLRRAALDTARRLRRFQQSNPIGLARAHVAHHYDISNDFYALMLDEDMHYSCAYFEHAGQSLEEAQQAKLRHVAAKLRIEPGMRVLDIGCGWGGMAMYLAGSLGASVVGVTLSEEQRAFAARGAEKRDLSRAVEFRLQDYREVKGSFDRIVSVGMFEHVGVPHYSEFFAKVAELLHTDGLALLHSIGRKGPPGVTGPWIRKYIFPGGYSPALSETLSAIERSGLWVTDIEILRLHYAETLRAWEERLRGSRAKIEAMFDERFCRMFEFYLAASEFAFRSGGHMVFQIQLAKSPAAAPLRRDYMVECEAELRGAHARTRRSAP